MEPSLRSSSYRPTECKLKRTDSALHETIQRFVESLDTRLSQYADINFAIKKFESKKWYLLNQIGRSGYLVFLPNTPVVWIDEQFKQSYKVQMRVSSTVYEKKTVLIASLNQVDSLLRLEDAWIVSGENLRNNPFTQRWNSLLEFFCILYKQDSALQQGLRIEPAIYEPLTYLKDIPLPHVILAQGENDRRLRVQLVQPAHDRKAAAAPAAAPARAAARAPAPAPRPPPRPQRLPVTSATSGASGTQAIAVAHPEYPDTYDLYMDGVKKGYAAVQDLDLSKRLKAVATNEIRVKIEWNPEFSMYEINDIL